MQTKKLLPAFFFCALSFTAMAQKIYSVDASDIIVPNKMSPIKMGNSGPTGKEILVNKQYLTIAGKPYIPVMGEFQFSRQPREQWEDKILKMKACGVNIVSTYLYWIHHEETEGQFDFSGNRDFRAFIELCKKHDMLVYPRIGPWVNSETRNGGTPDWIFANKIPDRSMDPGFLKYAERYIKQLCLQMEGLCYKDGGPIVGIQFENEYQNGKDGETYISWLKQTTNKYGIDVPLYSVTGWGDVSIPDHEVIPFYGDYPDFGWIGPEEIMKCTRQFTYCLTRNQDVTTPANPVKDDPTVELIKKEQDDFPFFTTEAGLGMFTALNRRLLFSAEDGMGILNRFLGSGSNLIGYYIFASGTNPVGTYASMQGTSIPMPKISYDFNTAITESGEINPSYYGIKKVHYFLNEFGDRLAPMQPVIGKSTDPGDMQFSARANEHSAFFFGMNYMRNEKRIMRKDVQFSIRLKDETVTFPSQPVSIADSSIFIWPVNFDMNGLLLKYATALPISKLNRKDGNYWIFAQNVNILPEFCFDATNISSVKTTSGTLTKIDNKYIISNIRPGYNSQIVIRNKQNQKQTIILLNKQEADQSWIVKDRNNKKHFYLFAGHLYLNNGKVELFGYSNKFSFKEIAEAGSVDFVSNSNLSQTAKGLFNEYSYKLPVRDIKVKCRLLPLTQEAAWLKIPARMQALSKVVFSKNFRLTNLSPVEHCRLVIAAGNAFDLYINNKLYKDTLLVGGDKNLDITPYIQKGENTLKICFLPDKAEKIFSALINIDYENTNRDQFITDSSWRMGEKGETAVVLSPFGRKIASISGEPKTYRITLPDNFRKGINVAYLKINYSGDIAYLYNGKKAVDDNANNNTAWSLNLNQHLNAENKNTLDIQINPYQKGYKIYFDRLPTSESLSKNDKISARTYIPDGASKIGIDQIKVVPEYKLSLSGK